VEHKDRANPFAQTAHDNADAAIDHDREVREKRIADQGKNRAEPRLIADGTLQHCSVCGYPFKPDVRPSMSVAFADHLRQYHKPGQTSGDV
jgi:hypothetical protein